MAGQLLIGSCVLSLILGVVVNRIDRRRHGDAVDPKKLRALQVAQALLFAYPFCVGYLWLEDSIKV